MANTCIIAIAGGSGSGKSVLAERIRQQVGEQRCVILNQDSYYHDLSAEFDVDGGAVNFDHPDAIEFSLLGTHLAELKAGRSVEVPRYDFTTHSRLDGGFRLEPAEFILLNGTLVLSQEQLRQQYDSSVFVHAPEALRFERRLARDIEQRGRRAEGVTAQWRKQVQPMHAKFVEQSAMHATQVVSGEANLDDSAAAVLNGLISASSSTAKV